MTDVLRATYADLKTVKTRSTCQLILELPIEALTEVVSLLGAPVPGNEVWVAVARLRPEAVTAHPAQIEPPEPRRPATLAQVAGILCNEGAFQRFVGAKDADEAADYIRGHCAVASRRDLDTNEEAAATFRNIRGDYELWMRGGEAA